MSLLKNKIASLHYLTQDIPHISHAEQVRRACAGGVNWVQLRVKEKGYKDWLDIATAVQEVCKKNNAMHIINDNAVLAKEIGADGVHLGKEDISPKEARILLGPNAIIGGTANSLEDVTFLLTQPVDYIGLGPFRFTHTKKKLAPVLGLDGIQHVVQHLHISGKRKIPVIAIGGIQSEDVQSLMQTGIHGIAVSSAINLSENPAVLAKSFMQLLS